MISLPFLRAACVLAVAAAYDPNWESLDARPLPSWYPVCSTRGHGLLDRFHLAHQTHAFVLFVIRTQKLESLFIGAHFLFLRLARNGFGKIGLATRIKPTWTMSTPPKIIVSTIRLMLLALVRPEHIAFKCRWIQ